MDYFELAGIEIQISALCLGIPEIGFRPAEPEAHRLLDFWVEQGGNFVDTARVYADWIPGESHRSERILGDWLKASGGRNRLVLATKGGHPPLENMSRSRLSPVELNDDLNGSLELLGTDYIDLWWLHRDDERIPVAEIVDACDSFVRDGRVKVLGVANWTAERIRLANDYAARAGKAKFLATQLFWNLGSRHHRGLEATMRPMDDAAEHLHQAGNLVAMPYSSQAGGFFTKWLEGDDEMRRQAGNSNYAANENFQIARAAGEIARRHGVRVGAVVLAYLRSHPFRVVPIVGCQNQAHLAASIQAMDFILSEADGKFLRELVRRQS
jgi:aryl-alcohol dehydrogenase-like predicted oxidoreductase